MSIANELVGNIVGQRVAMNMSDQQEKVVLNACLRLLLLGYTVRLASAQGHVIVDNGVADYWPTSSKWKIKKSGVSGRGLEALVKELEGQP